MKTIRKIINFLLWIERLTRNGTDLTTKSLSIDGNITMGNRIIFLQDGGIGVR